jgi:hypothetical protein
MADLEFCYTPARELVGAQAVDVLADLLSSQTRSSVCQPAVMVGPLP